MELNKSKNKNFRLNLFNSPYFIEYGSNVAKAIDISVKKGLLVCFDVDSKMIDAYQNGKTIIPLWVLEAACKLNSNDYNIPLVYQNIWFCLHNTILTRTQPSGRKFRTKLNFTSCYLSFDKTIKKLFVQACDRLNISQSKFSLLCGYKRNAIRYSKNIIPLTAVIKICQITNIDVWDLLEKYELWSKTNKEGKIIIPLNEKDLDIYVILIWLRTEGHLELGSTHIEINQKNNLKSLDKLRLLITSKFNLKKNESKFPVGRRGEDRYIIASSPLRQLLCLKYGFPLGYKTGCLNVMNFSNFSKIEYQKIMTAFIQTEGCLSFHYTRNKKKKLPRFEFVVKDSCLAYDCLIVMRKLGFNPTFTENQNIFKVGLYTSNDVINLIHQTKPYFFDDRKIRYLKKVCNNGI